MKLQALLRILSNYRLTASEPAHVVRVWAMDSGICLKYVDDAHIHVIASERAEKAVHLLSISRGIFLN